jgi:hypothetical protein
MKVDLADVEHILTKYKIDQKVIENVVEEAKQAAEDAKGDGAEQGGKKLKYKYLIVASDPDKQIPNLENIPMWVFKVPDDEKHTEVLPRFFKGVYAYNAGSRKGKKNPIKSIGDGIQAVGTKFFKPAKSPILTKEPVIVLVTDNKIPS